MKYVGLMMIQIGMSLTILRAQELKNVQVLPFKTKKEITTFMKTEVAKSLGVRCNFCHNLKDYSSDEKKHKKIAREMMKMVKNINTSVLASFKFDPISCWTCHRGDEYPERDSTGKKKAQHKN